MSRQTGTGQNLVAIHSLDPSLPSSTTSFRGTICLLWPYSRSKCSLSLLLRDQDTTNRIKKSQVRLVLHGHAAVAAAGSHLTIGDELVVRLNGAEWRCARALGQTPGKGIDWDICFSRSLYLQILRGFEQTETIDVDRSSPTPEPLVTSPMLNALRDEQDVGSERSLGQGVVRASRSRSITEFEPGGMPNLFSTSGSTEYSSLESPVRSKRIKIGRSSQAWRFSDRTPSPDLPTLYYGAQQATHDMDTRLVCDIDGEESLSTQLPAKYRAREVQASSVDATGLGSLHHSIFAAEHTDLQHLDAVIADHTDLNTGPEFSTTSVNKYPHDLQQNTGVVASDTFMRPDFPSASPLLIEDVLLEDFGVANDRLQSQASEKAIFELPSAEAKQCAQAAHETDELTSTGLLVSNEGDPTIPSPAEQQSVHIDEIERSQVLNDPQASTEASFPQEDRKFTNVGDLAPGVSEDEPSSLLKQLEQTGNVSYGSLMAHADETIHQIQPANRVNSDNKSLRSWQEVIEISDCESSATSESERDNQEGTEGGSESEAEDVDIRPIWERNLSRVSSASLQEIAEPNIRSQFSDALSDQDESSNSDSLDDPTTKSESDKDRSGYAEQKAPLAPFHHSEVARQTGAGTEKQNLPTECNHKATALSPLAESHNIMLTPQSSSLREPTLAIQDDTNKLEHGAFPDSKDHQIATPFTSQVENVSIDQQYLAVVEFSPETSLSSELESQDVTEQEDLGDMQVDVQPNDIEMDDDAVELLKMGLEASEVNILRLQQHESAALYPREGEDSSAAPIAHNIDGPGLEGISVTVVGQKFHSTNEVEAGEVGKMDNPVPPSEIHQPPEANNSRGQIDSRSVEIRHVPENDVKLNSHLDESLKEPDCLIQDSGTSSNTDFNECAAPLQVARPKEDNIASKETIAHNTELGNKNNHDAEGSAPIANTNKSLEPLPVSHGFRTNLSYYPPIAALSEHFNQVLDFIGIIADTTRPNRARDGPRDFFIALYLTDRSTSKSTPSYVKAEIYRPHRAALPQAAHGSAVLLRNFKVYSQRQQPILTSCESSSWAVLNTPTLGRHDVKGPPVEIGGQEQDFAVDLQNWWRDLDETAKEAVDEDVSRDRRPGKAIGVRKSGEKELPSQRHVLRDGASYADTSKKAAHQLRNGATYTDT